MAGRTLSLGQCLELVCAELDSPLVMIDVGASIDFFPPFQSLGKHGIIVGFDPDDRAVPTESEGKILVPKVVAPESAIENGQATFFLTDNPTCSSTLEPNLATLDHYTMRRRFTTRERIQVPAVTMAEVVADLGLQRVDWIKLDTQGTDLRILQSIPDELRSTICAIDAEPGFAQFYKSEDVFSMLHDFLVNDGFWLAELSSIRSSRIRYETFRAVLPRQSRLLEVLADISLKEKYGSPVAASASYLRAPSDDASAESLRRLWACAVAAKKLPFALEVAERLVALDDPLGDRLYQTCHRRLMRNLISVKAVSRRVSPSRVLRAVRGSY